MKQLMCVHAVAMILLSASTALAQPPATSGGAAQPAAQPPATQQPATAQPAGQPSQPPSGTPASGQAGSPPPAAAPSQAAQRQFTGDAGFILNFVKADKTADFEQVIAKLKEALQKSEKPERKQQAAGWKVYKAVEAGPNGSTIYVFLMDPAVKGQDYTVPTLINETLPGEAQDLYRKYVESFASGQNIVNLSLLSSLGQP